jgi:chromosomal replication initiator protein
MTDAAGIELKQSWNRIAQRLKAELGDDLYTSWFARMEPEECTDGRLAVSVPTRFLRNWIETHYAQKLLKASEAELGHLDNVHVKVRTRGVPQRPQDVAERRITREHQPLPGGRIATQPVQALAHSAPERGSPLDPSQTFRSCR